MAVSIVMVMSITIIKREHSPSPDPEHSHSPDNSPEHSPGQKLYGG